MEIEIKTVLDIENSAFRNPYNDDNVDHIEVSAALKDAFNKLTHKIAYNQSFDDGVLIRDINGNKVGHISITKK